MHAYNSENADLRVDHLGLHKALCALMSWNYAKPPDNSKAYQSLPAEEAAANLEDLIMWPPMVIIHNTITGKSKEGRMEGLGNKAMDNYVRGIIHLHALLFFKALASGVIRLWSTLFHLPNFLLQPDLLNPLCYDFEC